MKTGDILRSVRDGTMTVEQAEEALNGRKYEDLGFARLDTGREARSGFPEVIFCAGKSDDQLAEIYRKMTETEGRAFGTRATREQYLRVRDTVPSGYAAHYDSVSRILKVLPGEEAGLETETGKTDEAGPGKVTGKAGEAGSEIKAGNKPSVCVVTGGTSDIPVAEEAAQTAEYFGCEVDRLYDVGVSGIHRILSQVERLRTVKCVIAVAGMEGALASVVGGLVSVPVIAVPTSVGYGANLNGLSALLSMLNSCANGVTVVNIDNGYGAGYVAAQIGRLAT